MSCKLAYAFVVWIGTCVTPTKTKLVTIAVSMIMVNSNILMNQNLLSVLTIYLP
jgi:hypothetical protein